jgi:hypothetical protein
LNKSYRRIPNWHPFAQVTTETATATAANSAATVADEHTAVTIVEEDEPETASTSYLGSMFSFMRRSKNPATRVRAKAPQPRMLAIMPPPPRDSVDGGGRNGSTSDEERAGGKADAHHQAPTALPLTSIYLDDLTDDIEPEIAALYLRPGRPHRTSESQGQQASNSSHHFQALSNIPSEF